MDMDKSRSLMGRIKYFSRVMLVGAGFIYFGLGALFLAIFIFPGFSLFVRDKKKCRLLTQQTIKKTFCGFLWILKCIGMIDYRFEHLERFEEDHGCIIVANHPTLIDYIFMASCMPCCDSIVKAALVNNFFVRGVIKAAGYISNYDADYLLASCATRLNEQGMLLIFPEGTRTRKNQPIKLQRGAANIALRTKADIRMVTIFCDKPLLTKETKWYKIPDSKSTFVIKVEGKININSYLHGENLSLNARRLTEALAIRFEENLLNIVKYTHERT